jgi:mono/diheme cytochrome c family protein
MPVRTPPRHRALATGLGAAVLVAGASAAARADDHESQRVTLLPKYQQECASCHVAYPPGMLPAASWQRLMGKLARHFGTDASLDAASTKEIATWLTAHADNGRRHDDEDGDDRDHDRGHDSNDHRKAQSDTAAVPEDRITRTAWFASEHHEVAASAWKRPAVKSAANCPACHARADQGVFDEDDVRIPR